MMGARKHFAVCMEILILGNFAELNGALAQVRLQCSVFPLSFVCHVVRKELNHGASLMLRESAANALQSLRISKLWASQNVSFLLSHFLLGTATGGGVQTNHSSQPEWFLNLEELMQSMHSFVW